jgi:hypothetical protein
MAQAWSAVLAAILTGIKFDITTGIIVFLCLAAISPSNTD